MQTETVPVAIGALGNIEKGWVSTLSGSQAQSISLSFITLVIFWEQHIF